MELDKEFGVSRRAFTRRFAENCVASKRPDAGQSVEQHDSLADPYFQCGILKEWMSVYKHCCSAAARAL